MTQHPPIDRIDDAAVAREKVKLQPGDVILIRTGTLRHWGTDGDNHPKYGTRRHPGWKSNDENENN